MGQIQSLFELKGQAHVKVKDEYVEMCEPRLYLLNITVKLNLSK